MEDKKIKLVGVDLDGTLLDSQKQIAEYTKEVIRKANEQGCYVLASTGRPLSAVPQSILDVVGTKYVVAINGAEIIDMKTKEIVYESLLPVDLAVKSMEILEEYDLLIEVFIDDVGYTDARALEKVEEYVITPAMVKYMKESRVPVEDVKATLIEKNRPVGKVHAIFRYPEQREEVRKRLLEEMDVDLTGSSPRDLDVNRKGTNKGIGLVKLGEILGISKEEIMACGDSFNDYEMLSEVGLGVAMGNAEESLKAIADYITDTNDNYGVAKAIERFVLK